MSKLLLLALLAMTACTKPPKPAPDAFLVQGEAGDQCFLLDLNTGKTVAEWKKRVDGWCWAEDRGTEAKP